jgi:hypothetical protein
MVPLLPIATKAAACADRANVHAQHTVAFTQG